MIELKRSDLYNNHINVNNAIDGKIAGILSGTERSTVILNEILFADIKHKIIDRRKELVMAKMEQAIRSGRMVLFATDVEKKLPDFIPFFVYKQNGTRKVAVHLTTIINHTKDDAGKIHYEIGDNVNKVYAVLYSAYLALDVFEAKAMMSSDTLFYAANLWADMFTKPIFDVYGFNNADRYKAFKYFAMKFFLGYMMECTETQINDIVMKFIKEKNLLIIEMEEKIKHRGYNLYEGFVPFCQILFNNEISGINGARINNVEKSMNVSFYLDRFIMSFHKNSVLALCTFPYFIYVLVAASTKSNLVKDKVFDGIFKDEGPMLSKLLISILK